MAKTFSSIAKLMEQLKYDIAVSVNKELSEVIIDVYEDKIDEVVYSHPSAGYRRYDSKGGFADRDNISKDLKIDKNIVRLDIRNDAKGSYKDKENYLDEIIESGEGYQYGDIPARPVMRETIEYIEGTNLIFDVLKVSLNSKGYNVK